MPRAYPGARATNEEITEANLIAERECREASSSVGYMALRALTLANADVSTAAWKEALENYQFISRDSRAKKQSVVALAMFLFSNDEEAQQLIKERAAEHNVDVDDCKFTVDPMSY